MKLETIIPGKLNAWPYTHPSMPSNTVIDYYGVDSEHLYQRNLKYNLNWIYKDKKIKYHFNKQCLRMSKDLNEVDDDYIYFSGTSFCMGIGVDESDRFSEIISKNQGLDLINCSGPSYSIKAQFISFTNFINSGFKLPKIFVIEYPPSFAYTFYDADKYLFYYTKNIPEDREKYLTAYKNLLDTDYFINESKIYRENILGICKRLGIKFAEISFHKSDKFAEELPVVDTETNNNDINFCYGRDLRISDGNYSGHPGIGIHKLASEIILSQL